MSTPKADTRLLLVDSMTLDASQWETDLTASGVGSYEENSERTAIDGDGRGRSIEVYFAATTSTAGILVDHGGADDSPSYQLKVKSGALQCNAGGVTIGSLALPELDADPQIFAAQWSTEENPETGGSALRSELTIWNASTGSIARTTFTHSITTTSATDDLGIGGVWNGATLSAAYPDDFYIVRISSTYHPSIVLREDFQALTDEPDVDGWIVAELPRLPETALEADELAGPQYLIASPAGEQHRPRLASPLVQAIMRNPPQNGEDIASFTAWSPKMVTDLGDGWQNTSAWLWRVDVPTFCGWIVADVQVALWESDEDDPSELQMRLTVSDKPPGQGGVETSVELTRTTNDGEDGTGELLEFGRCFVTRDAVGRSWVWLSTRLVGDNASTRYVIRELSITPLSVPSLELPEEPPDVWSP